MPGSFRKPLARVYSSGEGGTGVMHMSIFTSHTVTLCDRTLDTATVIANSCSKSTLNICPSPRAISLALFFLGQPYSSAFLSNPPVYILVAFHLLLCRLTRPCIHQLLQLTLRRIMSKICILRSYSALAAPYKRQVGSRFVQQIRRLVGWSQVAQGHVDVLPSGEHCRHSTWNPPGPANR